MTDIWLLLQLRAIHSFNQFNFICMTKNSPKKKNPFFCIWIYKLGILCLFACKRLWWWWISSWAHWTLLKGSIIDDKIIIIICRPNNTVKSKGRRKFYFWKRKYSQQNRKNYHQHWCHNVQKNTKLLLFC